MSSHRPYSGGRPRRDYPPRPPSPRGPKRDSYRSLSSSYHPPPPPSYPGNSHPNQGSYYPPPPGYDSFKPPRGDFTFRAEKPPGIQDARSGGPPPPTGPRSNGRAVGGRDQQRHDHRSRRGYDGPYRPGRGGGSSFRGGPRRLAADRPFLNISHTSNQELSYADAGSGVKYRALEELSDSDEAEMDMSEGEGEGEDSAGQTSSGPSQKKLRTGNNPTAGNQAPKWSNPDPYTAIPPPDTTQQKKKDVVQLIRKARVQPAEGVKASVPADAADFISCGFSDDEEEVAQQSLSLSASQSIGDARSVTDTTWSSRPQPSRPADRAPSQQQQPLGSRKRTHNDQIIQLPDHARLKKHTTKMADGFITWEWEPVRDRDACPWFVRDSDPCASVAAHLHREILDFYEYVRPRDFEQKIRQGLVDDLGQLLRKSFRDGKVYPFGSFMSGLYLPTGDMDLAFCSDAYMNGGASVYNPKKLVFKVGRYLERSRVARDDRIETVAKARVPLVKYVDARTGLKVDISFENTSGVDAIKTFTAWREEYPAMPILVTLVKHFLAMRGLNEPVNGGVGGFSVVCLVVSMLQLNPAIQSRTQTGEYNLNEMLMLFFDLYGNKFDYENLAISLNPPKYIPKNDVVSFAYKNRDRLSIIDPNNIQNDISGGSSNTRRVVSAFSEAHRLLKERMAELSPAFENEIGDGQNNNSILQVILAGNYQSFDSQRAYLQSVFDRPHHHPQSSSLPSKPPPMRW